MRARIFLAIISILVLSVGFWLYTHSFIQVSANATGGGFEYEIKEQTSDEVTTIKSESSTLRKIVKKGNYQVVVKQKDSASVAFVRTKPFLQTTETNPKLNPERNRNFVGNSPSFCMYYAELLYSYDCNSTYNTLKKHMPASLDTPSYTENALEVEDSTLRSIFTINSQPYVFTERGNETDEVGITKVISPLRSDLVLDNGQTVDSLSKTKNYSVIPYKNGFVAYTDNLDRVASIQGAELAHTTITAPKVVEETAHPIGVTSYKNYIGLAYNSAEDSTDAGFENVDEEADIEKGKSRIVVYTDEKDEKTYTFSKFYASMKLCGPAIVCGLNSGHMDIYKLTDEPQLLLSMTDVLDYTPYNTSIVVVTESRVYMVDPATMTGSIDYSYGSYSYCGLQTNISSYSLCILDKDNVSSALLINPRNKNTDTIDKKIETLRKLPQAKSVTAYQNIITISQYTGEPVYDPAKDGFIDNPKTIQQSTDRINQVIDEIGIDRNTYSIVFTY